MAPIEAPDWLAHLDAQAKARAADPAWQAHREVQRVVAQKIEDLLAGDAWHAFVLHVEPLMATLEHALDVEREAILGALVGDDLMKAKLRAAKLAGQVEAWRAALALPEQILAQAKRDREKDLTRSPEVR